MVNEKTGFGVPSGVGVKAGQGYCIRMGVLPMGGSGWVGYGYRRRKRRLEIHATTKPGHGGNGKRRGKMRDMN
jgi:hypothetical protein